MSLIMLNYKLARQRKQQRGGIMAQKFPLYCNMSLFLLLITGYSAHNLYRSTWFILGAITGAVGLLQVREMAADPAPVRKQVVGAWVPGAEEVSPEAEAVSPSRS